jgi:argininosuccinate lyase
VPFRSAHHVVGALVGAATAGGVGFEALDDAVIVDALAAADDPTAAALAGEAGIADDVRAAADVDRALASCDVVGGTAPARVEAALAAVRERLERERGEG